MPPFSLSTIKLSILAYQAIECYFFQITPEIQMHHSPPIRSKILVDISFLHFCSNTLFKYLLHFIRYNSLFCKD
jgi:hypothetical protein